MSYTNSNPVARKSLHFPCFVIVFLLNVNFFLATGFEFVTAVTALSFTKYLIAHYSLHVYSLLNLSLWNLDTDTYFARNLREGVLVNFPFTLGLVSIKEILVLKGFGKAQFITNLKYLILH